MAQAGPYLPIISISRSQSTRIGRGPGNSVPNEIDLGDLTINPQTGGLITLFYANLGDPNVRRDYQHHSAIGALDSIGTASLSVTSDLFAAAGLAVTAGTGFAVNVAAGTLQARFYGGQLAVGAQVVTPGAPSATDRTDLVIINNLGVVSVVAGLLSGVPVYEIDTLTSTNTAGTFGLEFTYNGSNYTTATNLAFNSTAAAVAAAVNAATGGPRLPATFTGTGGPLGTAAVTLTASSALEGPLTNQAIIPNALTGGAASFVRTTQGSGGGQAPVPPGGNVMALAEVFIPSTATSSANYVIDTIALTS